MFAAVLILAAGAGTGHALGLVNGDLSKGSGTSPDHWLTQAWQEGPSFSSYRWGHDMATGAGELEVTNHRPNDARWVQSITLPSGWYHFSCEARAQEVGRNAAGVSISLLEDGISSPQLKGSTGWRRIGFYLKVGKRGADIELALRLGGFSSTNIGHAFFRDVRMRRLSKAPPPSAQPQYDLEKIRAANSPHPIGGPTTLIATYLALAVIAYFGWHIFGASGDSRVRAGNETASRRRARR